MSRRQIQMELDEQIREIQWRRNTYSSVFLIPQELLVCIFHLVRDEWPERPEKWHQIAHVCRHWRETAIGILTLWAEPPTKSGDYRDLMLQRSQTARLNIKITFDGPDSEATLTAISTHVGRIRALDFTARADRFANGLDLLLSSGDSLSQMEFLTVSTSGGALMLPAMLIQQPTYLRVISLKNFGIDWRTLPAHLTSFTFAFFNDSLPGTLSFKTFFEALAKMTSLQHLSLESSMSLIPLDVRSAYTDILTLPQLRCLFIRDSNSAQSFAGFLLSKLELPSISHLEVDAFLAHQSVLDSLIRIFGGQSRATIPVTLLAEPRGVRILTSGRTILRMGLPTHNNATQCLAQATTQIACIFPNLVRVDLEAPNVLDTDTFIRTFGHISRLQVVAIRSIDPIFEDLVSFLTAVLLNCSCQTSSSGAHSFPALHTVFLNNITWEACRIKSGLEVMQDFFSAVLHRADHGMAIKTLNWVRHSNSNCPPHPSVKRLEEAGIQVKAGMPVGYEM